MIMKANKITIPVIFLILTVSAACTKLDPVIDNTYGEDDAFGLPDNAEGILMAAYGNIPNMVTGDYGGDFLDAATDNAVTNNFGSIYRVGAGGLTVQHNPVGNWNLAYNNLRNIHMFLERGLGDNVIYNLNDPVADAAKRKNLKGEAFFLRAWWSFQLLQQYGGKTETGEALGYAIVLRSYSLDETAALDNIRRDTYEACAAQIVKDLDSAYANLPLVYSGGDPTFGNRNRGRADGQAALALKSRVALYAASPAYQSDDITQLNSMGQFSVVNEQAYREKWETAAAYAQEAIDVIGDFVSLKPADWNANVTPPEFIFRTYHSNRALETQNYPVRHFGSARTGPSQNLVDAFPAANGFPILDPRAGYDPQDPYANRDPRLAHTVMYNGMTLNGSPIETYEHGKDSRSGNAQNTRTGYYVRKWLSVQPGLTDIENPGNDHHYHAMLRRTELFLNLAEASNEAYGPLVAGPGQTFSAVDIIKLIRARAGISDQTYIDEVAVMGQDAFREVIQNERRIELAFENHRFFDMRRWVLPLNEEVRGVRIEKDDKGDLSYEIIPVEPRTMNALKYYYLPIPYNEIVKSQNLQNNLGW